MHESLDKDSEFFVVCRVHCPFPCPCVAAFARSAKCSSIILSPTLSSLLKLSTCATDFPARFLPQEPVRLPDKPGTTSESLEKSCAALKDRPPRDGLSRMERGRDLHYADAALFFWTAVAAFRITSSTKSGWDNVGTWLLSVSKTVAPIRFATKRSNSGWMVRSFVATMYQLGFDLHAVPSPFCVNKSATGAA